MCSVVAVADLGRLAAIAVAVQVAAGRSFIKEGDPAEHFFNVTAGTVKLFKLLPDGRRIITGFAAPGHFLGLAVCDAYPFGAEAIDTVSVCRYQRHKLRALLAEFPALERRLLDVASNQLVEAQEQMLLLGRKTARERLASFLIGRTPVAPFGASTPAHLAALPMTRADIADYLGLTVETVSRTLTLLTREGMIAIPTASRVTIRNPAALRALAAGLHVVAPSR